MNHNFLRQLFSDFKESSVKFSDILLENIKNNKDIIEIIFISNVGKVNHEHLKFFINQFEDEGREILKSAFMDNPDEFKKYWNSGKVKDFISLIMKDFVKYLNHLITMMLLI